MRRTLVLLAIVLAVSPALTLRPAASALLTVDTVPRFEAGPCPFPPLGVEQVECGHVVVPTHYARPDGSTIRLAVAVLRSTGDDPAPDPLISLEGSTGGPTLQFLDGAGSIEPFRAYLEHRDVILFDQRGVGLSEPSLDCPELDTALDEALPASDDAAAYIEFQEVALAECRKRLIEDGIDLADYTSAANAADVDAIRRALGYEQVTLFGVSYGTRLALTVLRDFPSGVRAAVLDSVLPPSVDLLSATLPNFDRALGELFVACNADPACATNYPGLEVMFWEVVRGLAAAPLTVQVDLFHPLTGETTASEEVTVDDSIFLNIVFQALYPAGAILALPLLIAEVAAGETAVLSLMLGVFLPLQTILSEGMNIAIQCADEAAFIDPVALQTAEKAYPRLVSLLRGTPTERFVDDCAAWNTATAPAIEGQPVISDIPVLVLAGQFDPITPPAWGRLTIQTLTNATFLEFPGLGHGAAFSDQCPTQIAAAFIADPRAAPDTGCIAEMEMQPFWKPS